MSVKFMPGRGARSFEPAKRELRRKMRVIDAAPDLLAACEALLAALKHVSDWSVPNIDHAKKLAAAAVLRAKGRR